MASTIGLAGSRIANATRSWQANEDADVTAWVKSSDFIVAAAIETTGGHGGNSDTIQLRWRNVTEAGSFTALAATGELNWTGATDLANGNAVTTGEAGCTGAGTWVDGVEREGANDIAGLIAFGSDTWSECHWAIDCSGAQDGDQYEFELYNVTQAASMGTCAAQLTIAVGAIDLVIAPDPYHLLSDNDGNPIVIQPTPQVAGAYHLHAAEGDLVLVQSGPVDLVIPDVYHTHASDSLLTETQAWLMSDQAGPIAFLGEYFNSYRSIRSIIKGANITAAGSEISLVIEAVSGGSYSIYIHQTGVMKRLGATHDSLEAPVKIQWSAVDTVQVNPGNTDQSDWHNFDVEPGKDLILSFDAHYNCNISGVIDATNPAAYCYRNGSATHQSLDPQISYFPYPTVDGDGNWGSGIGQYPAINPAVPGGYKKIGTEAERVYWVKEIWVRGSPYAAEVAGEHTLYIHKAVHDVVADQQIALSYCHRTDFHEFAKGAGIPSGWQNFWWSTGDSYEINADGSGNVSRHALQSTHPGPSESQLLWWSGATGAINADDVEVLTKIRADSNADDALFVALRGSLNYWWGSEREAYLCRLGINSDTVFISRMDDDDTFTTLNSAALSLAVDTWYWVRFRANGTNLYAKVWADGDPEPGPWTVTTTDSAYAMGLHGVGSHYPGCVYQIDYYEIAMGGLSAAGTLLVDGAYHESVSDNIDVTITAWQGGDLISEGSVAAARNYRMIVDAADFSYGESDGFVRLKLEAPPTEGVTISGASIGQRQTVGDLFDYDASAVIPVRFTFDGGVNSKAISTGQTVWSDWVPFAVDKTADHLIHIYINSAHKFPYNTTEDCYKSTAGNDQTMDIDVKSYSLEDQFLFLVRLEVRGRTQLVGFDDGAHSHAVDNIDLAQHFLTVADCYHTHAADPITAFDITISPEECYHTHAADTIAGFDLWVNVAEAYHAHVADGDLALVEKTDLAVEECYHLHDADLITGFDFWINTVECYHVHAAGGDLVLVESGATDLVVAETYHLHDADTIPGFDLTLTVADAYHTHVAEAIPGFDITISPDEASHIHFAYGIDIGQLYILTVAECYHAHAPPNINLSVYLALDNAYHVHVTDPTSLTQKHTIAAQEAYHLHAADNIDLVYGLSLDVSGAYHTHAADNIDLAQHFLSIADCFHTHAADTITGFDLWVNVAEAFHTHAADNIDLIFGLILEISPPYHVHAADNIDLGQHFLSIADCYHTHAADPITAFDFWINTEEAYHVHVADGIDLGQHFLTVADCFHLHVADGNINLITGLILEVAEAYHPHVADNIDLAQHFLAVADCYHTHAAGIIAGFDITLTVADTYLAHVADNVTLDVSSNLAVAESAHDHAADNIDFNQSFLVVADAFHNHAAEAIPGFDITITVTGAFHSHTADNIGLGGTLAINDSFHDLASDNVALSIYLTVAESAHTHAADNLDFNQNFLAVFDCFHTHAADAIPGFDLTVAVSECYHTHASDNVQVGTNLIVSDAFHTHVSDNINVFQYYNLVVAETYHLHAADPIALGQLHTLGVNETYHVLISDRITILPNAMIGAFYKSGLTVLTTQRAFADVSQNRTITVIPTIKRSIVL